MGHYEKEQDGSLSASSKRFSRRHVLGIATIVVMFSLGVCCCYFSPGNRFFRKYQNIRVGMTESQLVDLFSRSPDYACIFRNARIVYYFREIPKDAPFPQTGATSVSRKDQVPSLYGAAQILLDSSGHISAFTWNGEEVEVKTSAGSYPGDCLQDLKDDIWERLLANPEH